MQQGLRNNVFGTLGVARAALEAGVETCVLISTDKAVRPTNVMGATKRVAELIFQAAAQRSGTRTMFSMVRFGNVLGSSGSVVPLFRSRSQAGGPVTITHPEITRYFMTIPEAAQLVIQAGAMAEGGDVFVLDMGEPVRIVDLARTMIHLSGLTERDAAASATATSRSQYVGLRPGEKLYEELLIGDDRRAERPSAHHVRARAPHRAGAARQDARFAARGLRCQRLTRRCCASCATSCPEYRLGRRGQRRGVGLSGQALGRSAVVPHRTAATFLECAVSPHHHDSPRTCRRERPDRRAPRQARGDPRARRRLPERLQAHAPRRRAAPQVRRSSTTRRSSRRRSRVSVAGRLMLKRVMGKASFAHAAGRDAAASSSSSSDDAIGEDDYGRFKHCDLGDIVGAEGTLFKTRTGELSVKVDDAAPADQEPAAAARQVPRHGRPGAEVPPALRRPDHRRRRRARASRRAARRCRRSAASWSSTASWKSRRRCCTRSRAAPTPSRSSRTTTRSTSRCSCASRPSCT